MTTPKLHPDLTALLLCLTAHRVRFVVLGGHVLAILGRPRYTDDLDVLVEPTRANAARLARALANFGYAALGARSRSSCSGAVMTERTGEASTATSTDTKVDLEGSS